MYELERLTKITQPFINHLIKYTSTSSSPP